MPLRPGFLRPEFQAGLRASLPLLVAVGPFGLITGVAMAAGGIPPLEAMAMSILVYAGASMLAAPLAFIAMTVPFLRGRPMLAAGLSAGATAVLANGLPLKLGLALAAAVGICFGLLFERLSKVEAR